MESRYRHIIWDWNGTLLDDTSLCVNVLQGLLSDRGMSPISEEEYRKNFTFPVIEFYKYLGFESVEDSFEVISHEFIRNYELRWLKECSLHAGADDVLGRLADRGVSHSILSAAEQSALKVGIQHFDIGGFFSELSGADNIFARGKVEQGRNMIERLDWNPEEVLMVGDTLHDYRVAQAMGTDCILVAHGHNTGERLAETGARVVNSLVELGEEI